MLKYGVFSAAIVSFFIGLLALKKHPLNRRLPIEIWEKISSSKLLVKVILYQKSTIDVAVRFNGHWTGFCKYLSSQYVFFIVVLASTFEWYGDC